MTWYKIAKNPSIAQANQPWRDIRRGLMWGAGAALIPAAIGLSYKHPENIKQDPSPTSITSTEKVKPPQKKLEPQKTPKPKNNPKIETQPKTSFDINKILKTIKMMESSGGINSKPRFEPGFLERYRNTDIMQYLISKYGEKNAASSFGPYQIMLLKSHEMGFPFSPEELSDPANNEMVAKKIVESYIAKKLDLKNIFKRYNGGGEKAERYAEKAMAHYNK
jgi:hypothetical protein